MSTRKTQTSNRAALTAERVRELMSYDPSTGIFRWLVSRGSAKAGNVCGTAHVDGYWVIYIDGQRFLSHHVAWLYVKGEWPTSEIDHRDRDRGNGRVENLREATRSSNMHNTATYKNNKVGLKGVCIDGRAKLKKYQAFIRINGRNVGLGYFMTAEEAHAAYVRAAEQAFGEFARAA